MSSLILPSEPANSAQRDYPPWYAEFLDGSRIDAAGRDRHINFGDAVISRGPLLAEFGCTFPMVTAGGNREHLTVRVNFVERPLSAQQMLRPGAFWFSNDQAWGMPPQYEAGLGNFRPIYYRRASMALHTVAVTRRRGQAEDHMDLPPPKVQYTAVELGWQANLPDGTNVQAILWVRPELDQTGSVRGWSWQFRDHD